MPGMFRGPLIRFGLGALILVAAGIVAGIFIAGGLSSKAAFADQITIRYSDGSTTVMPVTAEQAATSDWKGSIQCLLGKGRYYHQIDGEAVSPLRLIYDVNGLLAGIHLYSKTEQATPWMYESVGFTGWAGLDSPHWGLGIYVINPIETCGAKVRVRCPNCY